ncbi:MAG: cell division protein ZapA [Gammaproteobacteria bacterium]|nr:cell division protein ZapA [Gammaproteobacteria bacterium]
MNVNVDVSPAFSVNILNKAYPFSCKEDEQDALYRSAEYLDGKMRQIQASGRIVGVEKITIMAALNIVHELLALKKQVGENTQKQQSADHQKLDKHLQVLHNKIKSAVARNKRD